MSLMASGASSAFPGPAGPPRYEQMKEEQELAALAADAATVVPLAPPHTYLPPRDHVAWSIFTTLYLNVFCLGFLALVYSVKARDCKLIGNHHGASSYGSTARSLNITALMLSLLFIIITILYFTNVIVL